MALFITIPLLLIIGSLVGIGFIIYRKVPYLKKLDVVGAQDTELNGAYRFSWKMFADDLFPEATSFVQNVHLKEYKDLWLSELEKLLRRFRLWFLRLDTAFDSLIKKIRKINKQAVIVPEPVKNAVAEIKAEPTLEIIKTRSRNKTPRTGEAMKQDEQKLIMEIAKTPKDQALYGKLGELYIEMSDWNDAKQSFEAAIELAPDNEKFKKRLSFVLEKVTLIK